MLTLSRKNKINLADYPYKRDIENRLLLAQLTDFEASLLQAIVNHSLVISIEDLVDELETDLHQVDQALEKLSKTKLFKKEKARIVVDKEMRKYYESQIQTFDENFQPDMEYIQTLLNKVSMHVLPLWYAIPRSSDNIYNSIIEKYFLTPEIYLQYLDELRFDDPIISKIIEDLYAAPNFKIPSFQLIQKYELTREGFEEMMLLLEYHFVCCIKYEHIKGAWHESVTFFQEWLDYMNFEKNGNISPIREIKAIKPLVASNEFHFLQDMQTILQSCYNQRLPIKEVKKYLDRSSDYIGNLVEKLVQIEFVSMSQSALRLTDKGALWLTKSFPERSAFLANTPQYTFTSFTCPTYLQNPRNIRLIEKALIKKTSRQEWYLLEDFVKGFMGCIGDKEPITLKNKGKKWKYNLPVYSEEELQFIRATVTERFFELGIVSLGTYKNQSCFSMTPFGRIALS